MITETGSPAPRGADFKALTRQLEAALVDIVRIDNVSTMLETSLENLLARFADELGFEGGRIYRREGEDFYLCCGFGKSRGAPLGLKVPRDYPPHVHTLADGLVIMSRDEPGFDPEFERVIGVGSTFAAIAVGREPTHVIAFSIKGAVKEEQLLYSLTAVRHVINLKLEQLRVSGIIEESRVVQESILPAAAPHFTGYDIDGRSRPAEIVCGDLYDYLPLSDRLLGIAIADSSGHGLPAALLARDVITGLRMGAAVTTGIAPVMEQLNRVIHRAALSSKFVSLFYGQLDRDGRLTYANAGHNPPLLLRAGTFTELDRGGTVLGPIPGARYETAAVDFAPGDTLVLYTDGIIERENTRGEPYGEDRFRELLARLAGASAAETVSAVLAAVDDHGRDAPALDDMTVLVVRRV